MTTLRTYTVVFIDRQLEDNSQTFLSVPCYGMDIWLAEGFWELRFVNPQPDDEGMTTVFLKVREHDLRQVVGITKAEPKVD
jgi:hypothetical protein